MTHFALFHGGLRHFMSAHFLSVNALGCFVGRFIMKIVTSSNKNGSDKFLIVHNLT